MIDPDKFDDDWAELARELERDKPASASTRQENSPAHEIAPEETQERGLADHSPEFDISSPDEFDDASDGSLDSETEGEGDPETEGELSEEGAEGDNRPGTGRKRRRRRRRKRKGAGGTAEAGAAEETEKNELVEGETEETEAEIETDYVDEAPEEVVDEPNELTLVESEEDAGGELLRELIANWNVPSWDDVVSGLYRPER